MYFIFKNIMNSELRLTLLIKNSPTKSAILKLIQENPLNISQLSTFLNLSISTIYQHIQELEKEHLINTDKIGKSRFSIISELGNKILRSL